MVNYSTTDSAAQSLGIFGYPLAHALSPVIQQAALDHHGIPARYHAWPVTPEDLAGRVEGLRQPGYLGANVTIPHKEAVLTMLDALDPLSQEVGAVNTIVKRGGTLEGHNTDVTGFLTSLKTTGGFDARGARALILGAGGAARAAAFGLASGGVGTLGIANRTVGRARALAGELAGKADVIVLPLAGPDLEDWASSVDFIVNCTSLGMAHGGGEGISPLGAAAIPESALVYDMVYTPAETPLLAEARKAGAKTVAGLSMLVYQGAEAFELWTGREAPVEVMLHAAERALAAGSDGAG